MTVAFPRAVAPLWIGRQAGREQGTLLVARALGGRELALGLGLKRALDRDASPRSWLQGGMLADGVDVIAAVTGGRELAASVRAGVGLAAGAWLAVGATLSRGVAAQPAGGPATR